MDGSVATFHFEVKELGQRLSDDELDELKKSRYGDVRGRQANLAESPAQLLLEAASVKQAPSKKVASDVQQNQAITKVSVDERAAMKTSAPQVDGKKSGGTVGDGINKVATSGRISSPVKQREYRRPDGRKRIIPEPVGMPPQQENMSGTVQAQSLDFSLMSSSNGVVATDDGIRANNLGGQLVRNFDVKERSGITARATISESLVIEKVPSSAGRDGSINVEQLGNVMSSSSLAACSATLSLRVFDKKGGEDTAPICLEACPREQAVNDIMGMGNISTMRETEVSCTRGSETLWSDRISGKVTVLAGNANFWAVGCEDGCLQVSNIFIIQMSYFFPTLFHMKFLINCLITRYRLFIICDCCYQTSFIIKFFFLNFL